MPEIPKPPSHPALRLQDLLRPGPDATRFGDLADSAAVRFTYSGRYGIYHALRLSCRGDRPVVLVPAFHCPTVVDPILHAGFDVRFYAIRPDLTVDVEDLWRQHREDTAAIVFIRYFGLPSGVDEVLGDCRARGALTIDDWTHCFLAANPLRLAESAADVIVYSFKKTVPSLTGGGLLTGSHPDWPGTLQRPPAENIVGRLKEFARQLRSGIAPLPPLPDLADPGTAAMLAAALPAVRLTAAQAYPYRPELAETRMPVTARLVLRRVDLSRVVGIRRSNYSLYAKRLGSLPGLASVEPELPTRTCPWGYPVLLDDRARHDYRLRALGVPFFTFGEVLHPLLFGDGAASAEAVATARHLADNLLGLALHQDLDPARIERYCGIIRSYFAAAR